MDSLWLCIHRTCKAYDREDSDMMGPTPLGNSLPNILGVYLLSGFCARDNLLNVPEFRHKIVGNFGD